MSNIGNKQTMAKNLAYYVEKSGRTQKELAEVVGVAASTFNDWMKAKKYPRIDKIEILADCFGILKSDLIEEKTEDVREMHKKNNAIADIVIRLRTDDNFKSIVEKLNALDEKKLSSIGSLLDTFVQ